MKKAFAVGLLIFSGALLVFLFFRDYSTKKNLQDSRSEILKNAREAKAVKAMEKSFEKEPETTILN